MKSDPILPTEILSIIVSYTLEPWPAHYGTQYQAAVASRVKNPFLLVNKACRQLVLDDFATTLWLELEWHGPFLSSPIYRFCPIPITPPTAHKLGTRYKPTVRLVWSEVINDDADPDAYVETYTIPFSYQDFTILVDKTLLVARHNFDLSVRDLTSRTSQYVDQVIKPLLSFLTHNPARGSRSKITMFGEHLPRPDPTFSWARYLQNVKLGYTEYRRLQSSSFDEEARSFALYASSHLTFRSLYDGICTYTQQISTYPSTDRDTPPRIQCMKILLEFSILADLVMNDLLREDGVWNHERSRKFGVHIGEHTRDPNMYFGFPKPDVARYCHANGLLNYTYEAVGVDRDRIFGDSWHFNNLVLANAMCPENDTWRHDFDNFFKSFSGRERDWKRMYFLDRVGYVDLDGVPREWIGVNERNDPDRPTAEAVRNLPVIQRQYKQWIGELEAELGIENGDWKMG